MPNSEETAVKGNRRKGTHNKWGSDFQGFVDIPLSPEDKQALQDNQPVNDSTVVAFLQDVCTEGYKFSLVEDPAHGCFIATVTGKTAECVNHGLALSARGPDAACAIDALRYKVCVLARWGSWTAEEVVGARQLSLWG